MRAPRGQIAYQADGLHLRNDEDGDGTDESGRVGEPILVSVDEVHNRVNEERRNEHADIVDELEYCRAPKVTSERCLHCMEEA